MEDNELRKMLKIPEEMECIPVIWDQKEIERCDKLSEPRGVLENTYDINYCIKMLKVIYDQCYQQRLNPTQLYFTLEMSIKKMIRHLEREKSQM